MKLNIFILALFISAPAYAEMYFGTDALEQDEIAMPDCDHNGRYANHYAWKHYQKNRPYINHEYIADCNLDSATGDDNPCIDPGMDIDK